MNLNKGNDSHTCESRYLHNHHRKPVYYSTLLGFSGDTRVREYDWFVNLTALAYASMTGSFNQ